MNIEQYRSSTSPHTVSSSEFDSPTQIITPCCEAPQCATCIQRISIDLSDLDAISDPFLRTKITTHQETLRSWNQEKPINFKTENGGIFIRGTISNGKLEGVYIAPRTPSTKIDQPISQEQPFMPTQPALESSQKHQNQIRQDFSNISSSEPNATAQSKQPKTTDLSSNNSRPTNFFNIKEPSIMRAPSSQQETPIEVASHIQKEYFLKGSSRGKNYYLDHKDIPVASPDPEFMPMHSLTSDMETKGRTDDDKNLQTKEEQTRYSYDIVGETDDHQYQYETTSFNRRTDRRIIQEAERESIYQQYTIAKNDVTEEKIPDEQYKQIEKPPIETFISSLPNTFKEIEIPFSIAELYDIEIHDDLENPQDSLFKEYSLPSSTGNFNTYHQYSEADMKERNYLDETKSMQEILSENKNLFVGSEPDRLQRDQKSATIHEIFTKEANKNRLSTIIETHKTARERLFVFIDTLLSSIEEHSAKTCNEAVIQLSKEDADLVDQFLIGANAKPLFIAGEIQFYEEYVHDETEHVYIIEENNMLWHIRAKKSHDQNVVLQGSTKAIQIIINRLTSYLNTKITIYEEIHEQIAPEELYPNTQAPLYSSTQYITTLWLFYLYCLLISQTICRCFTKTCKKSFLHEDRNKKIKQQYETIFRP